MKVIIELNEIVSIQSLSNQEESILIYVNTPSGISSVHIDELKLALSKLTAK